MAERVQYEFSLIRYVPDVVKGEFANIGVVLREFPENVPSGGVVDRTGEPAEIDLGMPVARPPGMVLAAAPGAFSRSAGDHRESVDPDQIRPHLAREDRAGYQRCRLRAPM